MTEKPIRYVILNGPPRSGKSSISIELVRALRGLVDDPAQVVSDSFAAPLKHFFAAALSEKYGVIDKELARPELNGYSMRQSLIALAEDHCKHMYGRDCFGRWLVHRSLKYPQKRPRYVVVDDGGFPEEVGAVPNKYIVQIVRASRDFEGDSRRYTKECDFLMVNDGNFADMWKIVGDIAQCIVNENK